MEDRADNPLENEVLRLRAERDEAIRRLEDAQAELQRFTYTVSHDLKSPIVTVKGFLAFLVRDAEAGRIDRLKSDVGRIERATEKMTALLDDLLEVSRIGRFVQASETIDMTAGAHKALEPYAARIAERGVAVEVATDMPAVFADAVRVEQVWLNLVDNAFKFLGDREDPRIEIGWREQTTDENGVEKVCTEKVYFVRDNGIGLDAKHHEAVFGLFKQIDPETPGTGVGLTLVQRITKIHGGRAWIESEGEGTGCCVFFTLPGEKSAADLVQTPFHITR